MRGGQGNLVQRLIIEKILVDLSLSHQKGKQASCIEERLDFRGTMSFQMPGVTDRIFLPTASRLSCISLCMTGTNT